MILVATSTQMQQSKKRPAEAVKKNFFKPFRRAYPSVGGEALVALLFKAGRTSSLARPSDWDKPVTRGDVQKRVVRVDDNIDGPRPAARVPEGPLQQVGKHAFTLVSTEVVRSNKP